MTMTKFQTDVQKAVLALEALNVEPAEMAAAALLGFAIRDGVESLNVELKAMNLDPIGLAYESPTETIKQLREQVSDAVKKLSLDKRSGIMTF